VISKLTAGGIHLPNLAHLLHSSISPKDNVALNGIAIISDIVASTTPKDAAKGLKDVLDSFFQHRKGKASREVFGIGGKRSPDVLVAKVGEIMRVVRDKTPMINQVGLLPCIADLAHEQRCHQRLG
jgi:thiamine-phosphate diphosphorylase/hydroxyethylthiazole kinase